jgi:hypothetical protein
LHCTKGHVNNEIWPALREIGLQQDARLQQSSRRAFPLMDQRLKRRALVAVDSTFFGPQQAGHRWVGKVVTIFRASTGAHWCAFECIGDPAFTPSRLAFLRSLHRDF